MNGNMYEVALDETWELFEPYLDGARSGIVCVLSERTLDARSKAALDSSAAALGYGSGACTFATLRPNDEMGDGTTAGGSAAGGNVMGGGDVASGGMADAGGTVGSGNVMGGGAAPDTASDAGGAKDEEMLDEQAIFLMLEGLDPVCLVLADAAAAIACARAYRCDVPLKRESRIFGRTAVAFASFPAMLNDAQDKQVAWALLKKLPKRGN